MYVDFLLKTKLFLKFIMSGHPSSGPSVTNALHFVQFFFTSFPARNKTFCPQHCSYRLYISSWDEALQVAELLYLLLLITRVADPGILVGSGWSYVRLYFYPVCTRVSEPIRIRFLLISGYGHSQPGSITLYYI